MADCGVSHRDLKPANILFDKYFILKVSDLGLSCNAVGNNNNYILTSIVGTDGYCPPEMYAKKYTGLQADIFATGVIIFNIYTGGKPF